VALPSGTDACTLWCCVHEFLQNTHNDLLGCSGSFHRGHLCRHTLARRREPGAALAPGVDAGPALGAVLLTMRLIFVTDVTRMMNADAGALAALTVLGPGNRLARTIDAASPIGGRRSRSGHRAIFLA